MRIVVTHEQPDFDALGSAALATVLFPGSVAALAGTVRGGVGELLKLYRDQIPIVNAEDVDLRDVDELIVVDTAERSRLGRFAALIGSVPVTVFDHHPRPADPVHGTRGLRESVGATVTLLARRLRAEGVTLPPPLASLALLGLHEDTGDLAYDMTTPDDHLAAAWLLEQGANLELVRRFRSASVPPELDELRDQVIRDARVVEVEGREVAVSSFEHDVYLPNVSGLCGELMAVTDAAAALLAAGMEGRTLVFGRATHRVDIGAALQLALGGGGHPRAAFARTDMSPEAALAAVLEVLPRYVTPPVRARDVMSRPVITVNAGARISDARQTLARYRHNGMPVVDDDGALVGVISRRDLDHAIRHGFSEATVSGFMTAPAITASPHATLRELETLVLEHDIGRLPIEDTGDDGRTRLVGIVTRSDLIRARHPRADRRGPAERVLASLPGGARDVLATAASLAGPHRLYLVGGTVRDGLLGVGYQDLDLVVERLATGPAGSERVPPPAETLARALQARLGGSLSSHADFGTASLRLSSGLTVDLASARSEAYAYPGALPDVREGGLVEDLSRRDFSVNALAVRVHPGPPELIDPFGGLADLEARRLRVLHPLSFVEDPTRLVRGARLAGRLGLRFDQDTLAKVEAALQPEVLDNVSGQRLRAELELTLQEPRVAPALAQLVAIGAMRPLYGLRVDSAAVRRLDEQREEAARRGEDLDADAGQAAAYLALLLASTGDAACARALQRFHWPRRLSQQRERMLALARGEVAVSDERLEALEPPTRQALSALAPGLREAVVAFEHAPQRPRVRGRDVIRLGLPPGPRVGAVLAQLEAARADGTVATFDQELELARRLVRDLQAEDAQREQAGPTPRSP
jgi:tRNA nucleotidyltransferase (CCA-adding enzyme)